MSAATPWSGPAPAKINLFLHVLGRRPDGYHDLESLVVFARDAAAADHLKIDPAPADLSLQLDGPFAAGLAAAPGDNLVLRAAAALRQATGCAAGAALTLTKNLPVASGIGGGSADAAAALHGLNALWGLGLDGRALAVIGRGLGADLPVCLMGQPSLMTGTGETLAPCPPLPPLWAVLVNPGVTLSTGAVFGALNGRADGAAPPLRPPSLRPAASAADLAIQLRQCRNDLEGPARFLCTEIDPVLVSLRAQGGCLLARMSGSGATCFGLFGAARQAQVAAAALQRAHPDWWVCHTSL